MKNFLYKHLVDAKIRQYLPWIWLAGCFAVYTIFMWLYGEHLLDADNSSEMVYAALLSEEGALFSDTWWYSTEIRVLYFHLIMIPLFRIFSDWHVIRTVGSVICNLIMLACYGYFCRGADLKKEYAISAAFLILPLSDVFFKYTAYGLQYVSYIAISFLTFGLLLRIKKDPKRHGIVRAVLLLALSFLNGMAGIRELAILYLPILLTALVCLWFSQYSEEGCRPSGRLAAWSLAVMAAAGAGYLFNTKVLAERYSYIEYTSINYVELSFDRLVTCLDGIIKNFGYYEGEVFSGDTVMNLMFGTLFLLTVYGVYVGIRRLLKGMVDAQSVITVYYALATAIYIILYLFTTMECYDRYYIPICAFAIPVAAYGVSGFLARHVKEMDDGQEACCPAETVDGREADAVSAVPVTPASVTPESGKTTGPLLRFDTVCMLLLMAFITVCASIRYYGMHSGDEDDTYYHRELVELLETEGYTKGYSTYWNGNLLVELSDGDIDIWVIPTVDIEEDGSIDNINEWLQRRDVEANWEQDGRCFLLFYQEQIDAGSLAVYLDDSNIIYSSWKIVCYGYESYEELTRDLGTFSYSFSDSFGYLSDGEDFMGARYLQAGSGRSGGPKVTFYEGTYEIMIYGDNLDQATVSCMYESRSGSFEIYDLEVQEDQISFRVDVDETREDCEVIVDNQSDEILSLKSVTVEKE